MTEFALAIVSFHGHKLATYDRIINIYEIFSAMCANNLVYNREKEVIKTREKQYGSETNEQIMTT